MSDVVVDGGEGQRHGEMTSCGSAKNGDASHTEPRARTTAIPSATRSARSACSWRRRAWGRDIPRRQAPRGSHVVVIGLDHRQQDRGAARRGSDRISLTLI